MLRVVVVLTIAILALAGCTRPNPSPDITGLLRAQGFSFLDEPKVTISPICSVRVGQVRYDFFWYEWRQQHAPGALHAAHRLIQIRDGQTYEGHYGSLQPDDRPTCRPESRELIFGKDILPIGDGGLPQDILVNGEAYTRVR